MNEISWSKLLEGTKQYIIDNGDWKEEYENIFKDAATFLTTFSEVEGTAGLLKVHMSFVEDGELNLWWGDPDNYGDMGFYGDGTYSYFFQDKDGKKHYGDDVPVSHALKKEIIEIIKA